LVLLQLLTVFPRYEKLFREFGVHLPPGVALLLDVSAWANGHVLLALVLTLVLTGLSVGTAHATQTGGLSRGWRLLVLLLVFGVPCGFYVLSWVGMLHTHRTLVEGLKK
jgi:type II secretory pathway component PulF